MSDTPYRDEAHMRDLQLARDRLPIAQRVAPETTGIMIDSHGGWFRHRDQNLSPSLADAIKIVENCEYENVAVHVILQRLKALAATPPAAPVVADLANEIIAFLFDEYPDNAMDRDGATERVAAIITRHFAATPAVKARYEKAHDARYVMAHAVHPDIVVLWFLALKSHWFDNPDNLFYGQREQAKAFLYKWVETGGIADDNTTLEIATAMKFREWLASSWTSAATTSPTPETPVRG